METGSPSFVDDDQVKTGQLFVNTVSRDMAHDMRQNTSGIGSIHKLREPQATNRLSTHCVADQNLPSLDRARDVLNWD